MSSLFSSFFNQKTPVGPHANLEPNVGEIGKENDPNSVPNLANDTLQNFPNVTNHHHSTVSSESNVPQNATEKDVAEKAITKRAPMAAAAIADEGLSTKEAGAMVQTPKRRGRKSNATAAPVTAVTPGTATPARKKNHDVNPSPKKKVRTAEAKVKSQNNTQPRQPPVKAGCRIKCRRSQIFHCLSADQQKYLPRIDPNFHNYYGTVVKKSKGGREPLYDLKLDIFPLNEVAIGIRRN